MSALAIYLALQADSLVIALAILAALLLVAALLAAMAADTCHSSDREHLTRRWKRFIAAGVALLFVAGLLPSSSTVAAMYVLPKLTSPEVVEPVTKEAKELYGLAKRALSNMAGESAADSQQKEH